MRLSLSEARELAKTHPELQEELGISAEADKKARREALTCYGYEFKSKTELAYAHRLESLKTYDAGNGRIKSWRYEPVTLHLPGEVSYTPDYEVVLWGPGRPQMHEAKPATRLGRERDSIVRLKIAASEFPMWEFYLCRYGKGSWEITEVRSTR